MTIVKKIFFTGFLGVFLFFAPGCVTLETQEEISITDTQIPRPSRERERGVYHKVKEGETLWRIAKTYDMAIVEITRINNIPKAAKIERNQLLFIPGVNVVREIILDTDDSQAEFIWPIKGTVIKYFHQRQKNGGIHKGISIQAQAGDTVRAAINESPAQYLSPGKPPGKPRYDGPPPL